MYDKQKTAAARAEAKEAKLRRKLTENDMNPVSDFILSLLLLCISPFMWCFAQIHDKLMFKFLNKTYIYNVSWEDPRMDQRVFNLNESDHVITIASAGCNVLDYIIEGAMVTAVDFNLCQIALTELKKVAIINCEFDVFFEIFSKSNMKLLREVYPTLRPFLSQPSAEFWDDGIHSIKSFMYSGTSGSMSYILFRVLFPLFGLGFIRKELVKPNASHAELLKKISNHSYGIRSLAWLMDNIMLRGGCCFAGVPERQMALGLHRPNNLAMVIERIFFKTDLVDDNYFYAGYFLGYYKETNCPRYLRRENYAAMKKHLINNKLKLVHGTMLSAINNTTTPITVASLLDHMDWMTDRMINEEMTHLIKKMDPIKGKIFWRTFADDVHSAPLAWLQPDRVDDKDDRVGMYWTTWIAYIKDCKISYEERCDTNQSKGLVGDMITGLKIVTAPIWKPFVASTLKETGHAKTMESFYKYQKDGYDAFREGLLLARPALMEAFPLKKEGNMIWVDVGGGTARNLEYFSSDIIRKYFKSIYILDISASLLEVAKKRVALMGLEDIVTIIKHDITNDSVLTSMKNVSINSVDIITMSYSFSMIPKQQQAIDNASKLLKKDGHLAIADFFLEGSYDYCLPSLSMHIRAIERQFQKTWFSMDNVHLLGENQLNMGLETLEVEWDNRFRGSVPFLPFLQPYHGVYILRKK